MTARVYLACVGALFTLRAFDRGGAWVGVGVLGAALLVLGLGAFVVRAVRVAWTQTRTHGAPR